MNGQTVADAIAQVATSTADSSQAVSSNDQVNQAVKLKEEEQSKILSPSPSSTDSASPPNNEKVSYFIKLHEITKVLVKQVIIDCRLIEKILDSYAQEKVPIKSQKSQPQVTAVKLEAPDSTATVEAEVKLEQTTPVKNEVDLNGNNDSKLEVDQTGAEENSSSEKDAELSEIPEKVAEVKEEVALDAPQLLKTLRPGYMGHLRLIANVLKERCTNELLTECELDPDVLKQWIEFKEGKLAQFNELINSKLVEESKYSEINDQVWL